MRKEVEIRGLDGTGEDVLIGTVVFENGEIHVEPEGDPTLTSVLESKIPIGRGERIGAEDNPDEWMSNLWKQYKSAYLRASKAIVNPYVKNKSMPNCPVCGHVVKSLTQGGMVCPAAPCEWSLQ